MENKTGKPINWLFVYSIVAAALSFVFLFAVSPFLMKQLPETIFYSGPNNFTYQLKQYMYSLILPFWLIPVLTVLILNLVYPVVSSFKQAFQSTYYFAGAYLLYVIVRSAFSFFSSQIPSIWDFVCFTPVVILITILPTIIGITLFAYLGAIVGRKFRSLLHLPAPLLNLSR